MASLIDNASTVEQFIKAGASLLDAAGLAFGHGTDNAVDDAAELVFFAAGLRHEEAPAVYARKLTEPQKAAVRQLLERRIRERVPTAYLTHRMWFAGHEFYVDERVLVPRSPIAELIETGFEPWIDADRIRRLVDIGTGSGCIAIASALALPEAAVDAVDVSESALAVTRMNMEKHGVTARVRAVLSDVYASLGDTRYDVIVSNPPYVSAAEMEALPEEYHREPELGLRAGDDGLDVVRRLLAGAGGRLNAGGILVVEVGDSEEALVAACPGVPFTWLEFERGGGGVFLLTEAQVAEHQHTLGNLPRN
ncbi:MAG: 50S ribosomal protein L3 N(5)-glutamine methyltransferase [Steroidobacteraceae bacterium]